MSTRYKFHDSYAIYFVTFAVIDWIDVFTRNDCRKIMVNSITYCIDDASILAARASVYLLLKNLDAACKDWNAALKSGSLESREYIDKYCNGKT